jgi:hypothetical protein
MVRVRLAAAPARAVVTGAAACTPPGIGTERVQPNLAERRQTVTTDRRSRTLEVPAVSGRRRRAA